MAISIRPPLEEVFEIWGNAMSNVVGENNYSMEKSETLAPDKKEYVRLFYMGGPRSGGDLEGDEAAINMSFQVDSFSAGAMSLSRAYEIDYESHKVMTEMGFIRTYGPELVANIDNSIKRIVSRYSRLYTGQLVIKE